ncbi:MAG: Holliday junction ATP-dependent DNA helicase RuvA [Desulfovibrionaceae bacterium]|nr:Holliday junction ATP-dependent DNA helicase RuvA [Desulfovibrionaceae bacterium]
MIALVEGILRDRDGKTCTVMTAGGIGYEIFLSASALRALPDKGVSVSLIISEVARKDDIPELYGFVSKEEKSMFSMLLGVSGVGAHTAMNVLSLYAPEEIRRGFQDGCPDFLIKVPGIGKKAAQRIFLELRDKILKDAPRNSSSGASFTETSSVFRDTLDACFNLGYAEEDVIPIIREALGSKPDAEVGELLRVTLKALAQLR